MIFELISEITLFYLRPGADIYLTIASTRPSLAKSKLQDNKIKVVDKKPKKDILPFVVRYKNHGVEKINMQSLIRKKKVCDTLPSGMIKEETPMVVYKYEPTIRNKIFNYKETAEEYEIGTEENMSCQCEGSVYRDPPSWSYSNG